MLSKSPSSKSNSKIEQIQVEIDNTKQLVMTGIEHAMDRGDKLEMLEDKAENLRDNSSMFNKQSRKLKNKMLMKRIKATALIVMIILLLIFFIVWAFCGFRFEHC